MRRAIFLDRDGVLNVDKGYVHRLEDWEWLPGAIGALAAFKKAGWLLLVVSNQSGIGRGYYSEKDLLMLQDSVSGMLKAHGAAIDGWSHCPHAPGAGCACRKPLPGMLLAAGREWDVDMGKSWMLGDRASDVRAGLAAGCRAGLLLNPAYPEDWRECEGICPRWPDLLQASADIIAEGY